MTQKKSGAKKATEQSQPQKNTAQKTPFAANIRLQALIVATFAFLLYTQTISFEYAADDGMVILGHRTVQQGFAGIPELLTSDSFRGLDEAEGRTDTRRTYRPLSFITFAIEYQFFGKNAQIQHFTNVALYSCALALLLLTLHTFFRTRIPPLPPMLPFLVCCLFAAHPIHTEVVANIKSRDEILAFIGCIGALYCSLKWLETSALKHFVGAVIAFALALLSKESAVTFTPVVPLALYLADRSNASFARIVRIAIPLAGLAVLYLVVWFGIIGRVEDKLYFDTLNNPFANATFAERTATATMILGVYLVKSLFPWTLSTGYTYNQFPLVGWTQPQSLLLAVALVGMLLGGIVLLLRKHLLALCLLGWCCTMAIASNYFVYAGGLLGERFLFTPSLFAMIALVWLVFTGVQRFSEKNSPLFWGVIALVTVLYSAKTLARTADWRTTETLLAADVVNTPNSIHLRRMYGGLLLRNLGTAPRAEIPRLLRTAQEEFRAGLRIDSTIAPSLYNGLGNTFTAQRQFDSAAWYYAVAHRLAPENSIYRSNLANALTAEGVRLFGLNTPESRTKALSAMQQSASIMPTDSSYSNLGAMYASENRIDSAIVYLEKALSMNPTLQRARKNLAFCYRKRGDTTRAAQILTP
jgi:hypothetical protein